ncbi:TonB-dependent siderophore receptor [Nostoc sp. LPT]|uniref:TonB-dependent siderophore receptor n=1 Tax=Nostoc sp. LPT TaxID=2815387 RepID=UPI001D6817D7|nr:TonB-dependent siderophore receptor [Nostoc sp. LPT]MBN4006070.1 TonB-dependent siderophore receptor [Nostoc sp. LPT]
MRIQRLSSIIWLWLVMSFLPMFMAESVRAEVKQNSPTVITKIKSLSEIERPATNVSGLFSQSSTPQATPIREVVQVRAVKANPTNIGVEVILQTSKGEQLQVTNRSTGNSFIADIPNAQLRLPSGEAFTFRSEKPLAGITEIIVNNFDANTIRVTVIGEGSSPTVELFDSDEGLIFGLTTAASTAQQPPTQQTPEQEQPANQTPPEQPSASSDEPIELVVTGEQDGYRVPDASTATKTDTLIRDIPASIQVIPQQVLKDQQITQVREAVSNVSGITPGSAGSQTTFGENFIFRGFADSFASGGSTFVNGFRRYNALSHSLDVANIEQLEVLKGPASVLYGQGEPGGILNIVTKQPLSTPYYAVEGTIGNFDFYRPTLDLSGPLNTDKTIRYRLNMAYENSGSFVDFVKTEQAFIAPVISFDLGKNTTLVLEGEYINTSKVEYLGIPAVGSLLPNPLGRVPRSRFIDDPDFKLERDFVALGYRLQHKFSDNWSIRNAFTAELEDYNETFDYSLGLRADDNRTVDRGARFDQAKSRSYFLQTDVIGKIQTGIVKQDLLFGLELGRTNYIRQTFDPTPTFPAIDLFNPNYDRPSIQFDTKTSDTEFPQNLIGVYAQDLISIGDKLKILLGGRFDFVEASFEDTVPGISRDQEDTAFSPRIGIVYQPIQPVSLYASYSRSFQPSSASAINADNTPFEPTKGESFEVGVKSEFFDARLSATLAAYQITKQNIVVDDPDPANQGFSLQIGEQRSRGIELDVAGEILPGWKIIASYAYIDPEITEDTRPEYKGNEPSNVARNSASLWTTYEIQTGNYKGLGFGGGLFFVGDRQGDLENTFTLPSYVRTDAAIYYRRDNWRVGLNIKNLFDVYYFESADSIDSVYPAAPFTVLGTVSVQF